jgi:hypothetical protein
MTSPWISEPPEIAVAVGERGDDVDDSYDEEEPAYEQAEHAKRLVGIRERDDRGDEREDAAHDEPPLHLAGPGCADEPGEPGEEKREADEDRHGQERARVVGEDDEAEDEVQDPGDEEEPPTRRDGLGESAFGWIEHV